MGKRGRVARILQLAGQLLVGDDLPRVVADQPEETAQQSGLVDAGEQQQIARDGRLNDRVEHEGGPARLVFDQRRRPRISAEVDELVEAEAEGVAHLAERPVRRADRLEAPGEALAESFLDEQRGRAEQHDAQWQRRMPVLVPESLDRLCPTGDLLNLIDCEHGGPVALVREPTPLLPLRLEPGPIPQGRIVGAGVVARRIDLGKRLLDHRRLPDLPRPTHDLDPLSVLGQARNQGSDRPASICPCPRIAHRPEQVYSEH